jgi:hypothetical protein
MAEGVHVEDDGRETSLTSRPRRRSSGGVLLAYLGDGMVAVCSVPALPRSLSMSFTAHDLAPFDVTQGRTNLWSGIPRGAVA